MKWFSTKEPKEPRGEAALFTKWLWRDWDPVLEEPLLLRWQDQLEAGRAPRGPSALSPGRGHSVLSILNPRSLNSK